MASIRITNFGGIRPEISTRLLGKQNALVAHNCVLWDGSLRAMAAWTKINVSTDGHGANRVIEIKGSLRRVGAGDCVATVVNGKVVTIHSPQFDWEEPMLKRFIDFREIELGIETPQFYSSTSVSYERGYFSDKPVNRLYAISGIRTTPLGIEEGPLALLPGQNTSGIIYEGDIANLFIDAAAQGATGFRLYRSISGLDTGKDVTNSLDTEWYLVHEFGTGEGYISQTYIDGGSATTDPLDLYLAGNNYKLQRGFWRYVALTESGFLVASDINGYIAISERYLFHAWPTDNYTQLPATVTDLVANNDNVYVGTNSEPYILSIIQGEKAAQIGVVPYKEAYGCLPGTMCRTPSGAIYCSNRGVVTLSREGMQLVTAGMASAFVPLYRANIEVNVGYRYVNKTFKLDFKNVTGAAYHKGEYYGFAAFYADQYESIPSYACGFRFNTNNSLDGKKVNDTLTTFDFPLQPDISYVSNSDGLFIGASNPSGEGTDTIVVTSPLPGDKLSYDNTPKMCYEWVSNKIVLSGPKVMAAAKVIHDCKGWVKLSIIVDGKYVYSETLKDCKPFNLPASIVGTEFQIRLDGTSTVREAHIASSMQELTNNE